jgi:hypothetical protein
MPRWPTVQERALQSRRFCTSNHPCFTVHVTDKFQSTPVATIAVLWMWFMTVVLMFPAAPAPVAESMNFTVVVMGGVLFLAFGYYYFPRYGGRHWFKGPVANIEVDRDEGDSAAGEKADNDSI